jgi:hypothetical protein
MNSEILATGLTAAQQHSTRAGGMMMLGVFIAIALVALAVALGQRKRARARQQWNSHDRPAQNTRSQEEK